MNSKLSIPLFTLGILPALWLGAGSRDAYADRAVGKPSVKEFRGDVSYRRKGWTEWSPLSISTELNHVDLIHVGINGFVAIDCPDGSLKPLPVGQIRGIPCSEAEEPLALDRHLLNRVRGDQEEGEGLTLLSPRWTWLSNGFPTLRWTAPPGVKLFKVTLLGGKQEWTTTVSSATSLPYPKDAPPLVPGEKYAVMVRAGALSSLRDGEALPIFQILPSAQAAKVRQGLKRIQSLKLVLSRAVGLEADWRVENGLFAEAIETGEASVRNSSELTLHRALGRAYEAVGLNRQAAEHDRRALELAKTETDTGVQAQAAEDLARLCSVPRLCKGDEARLLLEMAGRLYQQLGAKAESARVRSRLRLLE
jgi:hypothetical protein